jgi:DNA-binding CsgD family transcriptional regulator
MELWERSAALDLLDALVAESGRGGRVVLVAGEAGLGKTALLTEFASRWRTRARVLWGACDPLLTPRALGPLHDIGHQTGGLLAARLASGSREEIFAALLDELSGPRQRPRPVVVVEDAHWADEATLEWLVFLARRIGRLAALLVVTYRDDEVGADHPLRRVLGSLPSAVVRRVPLPPLSAERVADEARRHGRDPAVVRRLAGGNPLLVTEIFKADVGEVPAAVQDLILERIAVLPEPARDVAHLVAVVPGHAETALVSSSPGEVDRCVDAGVLVPAGNGLAYRHELLRTAVERSLTPVRRALLHARVLRALEQMPGVDPGRLVHHAVNAGDADAVLRHGQVAGYEAARQGAHREAAMHYGAAVDHADSLPDGERARLFERYAAEAHLAGLNERAVDARETALRLREALGQPEQVAENLRWISRLSWWTGQRARTWESAVRAVEVLEGLPPGRELAMAYSNLSQLHTNAYQADEAVVWGERAQRLAAQLGDVETQLHASVNAQTARLLSGEPTARDGLERVYREADRLGFVDHAARALLNVAGITADELVRYGDALPLAERALAYAQDHQLDGWTDWLLGARAKIRFERCEWSGALTDAHAALDRFGALGVNAVLPLVVLGRIHAARGSPDALPALDRAWREAARIGDGQWLAPAADARAEYFLWQGDEERAREEARRGLALAGIPRQPYVLGRLAYRLWRAGARLDDLSGLAPPFRMMIEGNWAGAAAAWQASGAEYLRVEALSGGDAVAAGEALRILDGLGAVRAAADLRARLRLRGVTGVSRGPRPATRDHPAGLTARQVDVLALLADGLSNADIARRLTLSPKTVDHHISAVLGKLGVANRGQAVAAAHRLNLLPSPRTGE